MKKLFPLVSVVGATPKIFRDKSFFGSFVQKRTACFLSEPILPLHGNIADITHTGAYGWVIAVAEPLQPVEIEILADGAVIARARATLRRPDLEIGGIGGGHCGFDVRFRRLLRADRDHVMQIRRAGDGAQLPGSPQLLPRQRVPYLLALSHLHGALNGATGPRDRRHLAAFLAGLQQTLTTARMLRGNPG